MQKDWRYKHGEGKTRLYRIWATMKQRCQNPHDHAYAQYGGRGITVCNEWSSNYLAFKEWAINNGYMPDLTIDRINNDKGYTPNNCRWATKKEQQHNKRNNINIAYKGEIKTMTEWANEYNIGRNVLWNRLFIYDWPFEKAITTPTRRIKH